MKIKSVYIDGLHNAVNKTYEFGDIVYIFGHNGAGKSTILQAIQFALLGYIPGTNKTKEAILRHSPKGRIAVKLELISAPHDSTPQSVTLERTMSKTESQLHTVPGDFYINTILEDLELPIFNFNEFVGQTANKLKEYFIKKILPTTDGNLDWSDILANSLYECNFNDKDTIVEYGMSFVNNLEGEVIDQVILANSRFKEEQSFNKSEIQRLQNTIDSLIYYDDYVGPTNIDEINSNLLSLNAIRDQLIRYNSAAEATKMASEELARLKVDLSNLGGQDEYDRLISERPKLIQTQKQLTEDINTRTNALAALRAADATSSSIIHSNGICPYTKEVCKSIKNKIDELRQESLERKANNAALSVNIDELNIQLARVNQELKKIETTLSDFQTIWNRIITLEKTMQELPQKPATEKDLSTLDIEIQTLTESKSKLEANIRYNETIENITKLKYEAELKGEALSHWIKKTDTNGLQTTLMEEPFNELANKMTKYIQQMYNNDTIKAHFNVSNKANSFSFGLIRDKIYIPYDLLSSGEKCLYTLALMICIVNNNKSPLKVLLLDDAFDHLDSNAIEATFATLKNISDIQFIFAGVKECQNAKDIILTI